MPLTKKYIAIIVGSVVAAFLIIAGIVVTIVLVTKKSSKDSAASEETTSTILTTALLPITVITTTTVSPIAYANEILIIAFNIGYQNDNNDDDDATFADLHTSLNELINALNFNGSLLVQLIPYSDKPSKTVDKFDNAKSVLNKINEILSSPENITGENPSQIQAITVIYENGFKSNRFNRHSNFASENAETKYCFYSPPKSAYANPDESIQDSQKSGILISNIIVASNFALILMPNMSIADYNVTANENFIDTTYDNVTVAIEFLNPDQILRTSPTKTPTTTPTTTPILNVTVFTAIIGGTTPPFTPRSNITTTTSVFLNSDPTATTSILDTTVKNDETITTIVATSTFSDLISTTTTTINPTTTSYSSSSSVTSSVIPPLSSSQSTISDIHPKTISTTPETTTDSTTTILDTTFKNDENITISTAFTDFFSTTPKSES